MTDLYINNKGWQFSWTNEEDDVIREYYPISGTSGVQKYLPHRNQNAIKSRAAKIGVKYLSYDECYFDKIDSHEKAYWLGFLYADGYVTTDHRWGLELQSEDIEHMQNLLNAFDANLKIKTRERKCAISCLFQIKNTHMFNSLVNNGVIPNKTAKLSFPSETVLKKDYYPDFIRGFFDGDGTAVSYVNKKTGSKGKTLIYNRYIVSIVCKSEDFLNVIKTILNNAGIDFKYYLNKRDNLPFIQLSDAKNIRKFFDYIYQGSSDKNRLKRKYEKMCDMISLMSGGDLSA